MNHNEFEARLLAIRQKASSVLEDYATLMYEFTSLPDGRDIVADTHVTTQRNVTVPAKAYNLGYTSQCEQRHIHNNGTDLLPGPVCFMLFGAQELPPTALLNTKFVSNV